MKAVAVCSRAGIWEGQVGEWRLDLPGRARGRRDGGWSSAAGAGRGLGKQRRSGTAKIQSHLPGGRGQTRAQVKHLSLEHRMERG